METNMNGEGEQYGVPMTVRVSGSLKHQLSDEAAARGLSLAQYAASVLVSGHRKSADLTAEVSLMLKRLKQQQQEMQAQESELAALRSSQAKQASRDDAEKPALAKLRQNYQILLSFTQQGSATEQELRQAGLDFNYITSRVQQGDKLYYCVFGVCYLQEGERFIIDNLGPQHV